jgi:hypothetical protein
MKVKKLLLLLLGFAVLLCALSQPVLADDSCGSSPPDDPECE